MIASRGWSMNSRKRRGSRGSTLIEFALVVMVLMTLMLGVFEFSRLVYAYHFVSSSARRTARWAAVNGSTCADDSSCNGTDGMNSGYATAADIASHAQNLAPTGVNFNDVTASAWWPLSGQPYPAHSTCSSSPTSPGCNCFSSTIGSSTAYANSPGCTVAVTVSYDFHFIFPFVQVGTVPLSSTSQSVITH